MRYLIFSVRLEKGSCTSTNGSLVIWVSFEVGIRYSLDDEASFLYWVVGRWCCEGEGDEGQEEEGLEL